MINIKRIENNKVYNPIRDHIKIGFKTIVVSDSNTNNKSVALNYTKLEEVALNLEEQNFNPETSRVLIFINSKKKNEEGVEILKSILEGRGSNYSNKIDYYHAGLDSYQREERYDNFQKGETVILFATKAFGMGMDIKNIHFIYHIGPSSSFEDFLQEVGRAGRNKESLRKAGYSVDKPIQTFCMLSKDDFRKMKDRNHKSQITTSNIQDAFTETLDYIKNFGKATDYNEKPFSLPLDLLSQSKNTYNSNQTANYRVILYWLEQFKRIKLGMFTGAQFPIELTNKDISSFKTIRKEEVKIKAMLIEASDYKNNFDSEPNRILVEANTLVKWFGAGFSEVIPLLIKTQELGYIKLHRYFKLEPTKLRTEELQENSDRFLTLNAIFNLTISIMDRTKLGEQIQLSGNEFEEEVNFVVDTNFKLEEINWKETKNKGKEEVSKSDISKKIKKDFKKKRSKFALFLINSIPNVNCKTNFILEDDTPGQLIYNVYNGCNKKKEWKNHLEKLEKKLSVFIRIISQEYFSKSTNRYNIIDFINTHSIKNEEEFQTLVRLSNFLGYLKGDGGSITSMGIECYLKDFSDLTPDDLSSNDNKIASDFIESNNMKELRLLTLECLSDIKSEEQDTFIKSYFQCESMSELIFLLETKFGEDHENLRAFREEALKEAEKKLNEEQKKIYEAPNKTNLQVIAGPGSGKTHTLVLRVAKLIQKEKVPPEEILILAYNRAVVIELKERLNKLFSGLGYGMLIKRLKVFTFHGFIKFMINEELENKLPKEWASIFLNFAKKNPGVIAQKLGQINYVFVDEFQDITYERLDLLKHLANPENVNICVIGDPNQSVYGYQRAEVGDPLNPIPYYNKFKEIYNPKTYNLVNNYRSYPNILKESEKLLSLNKTKFEMPALRPMIIPENNTNTYCERVIFSNQNKVKWQDRLLQILKEGSKYETHKLNEIAVMFRSNAEVFRAFNLLKIDNFKDYRIRVQGSDSAPIKSREFHYLIGLITKKENEIVLPSFKDEIKGYCDELKNKLHNWDNYLIDLFQSLVLEFIATSDEDSKYKDLEKFIRDISDKEEGHLNKIYKSRLEEFSVIESKQEIVLTTMHRVKGIEFDAVLIPPSFIDLGYKYIEKIKVKLSGEELNEILDEERRLYYVAYTRAKYRLCIIEWKREEAMRNTLTYKPDDVDRSALGVKLVEGINKYYISWGAIKKNENRIYYIEKKVKIGDEIEIIKIIKNYKSIFEVYHKTIQIGQIAGKKDEKTGEILTEKLEPYKRIKGFRVSSVEIYTYKESIAYDEKHDTDFSEKWSHNSKERGYIYLADFSGYGK